MVRFWALEERAFDDPEGMSLILASLSMADSGYDAYALAAFRWVWAWGRSKGMFG